ncbi:hypothetical protein GCM10023339_20800 [Alloalcanivorax gelatiniphagus]
MAALQDQQRLAHGTPAHFQLAGHAQFLNPVAGQHFTSDDLTGQMTGNLLGKAFPGFECHGLSNNPLILSDYTTIRRQ